MFLTRKRAVGLVLAVGAVGLLLVAIRPSPIRVEVARATAGPLLVTLDEEGQTRAQDRFVVSAPVAGRLARIELDDGDPIAYRQVLAVIDPSPLGPRERDEVLARVEAARASKREADARLERARADHDQARRDFERARELAKNGIISAKQLDQAQNAEATTAQELEAAKFRAQALVPKWSLPRQDCWHWIALRVTAVGS
jgi:HlyD family secretion protein